MKPLIILSLLVLGACEKRCSVYPYHGAWCTRFDCFETKAEANAKCEDFLKEKE